MSWAAYASAVTPGARSIVVCAQRTRMLPMTAHPVSLGSTGIRDADDRATFKTTATVARLRFVAWKETVSVNALSNGQSKRIVPLALLSTIAPRIARAVRAALSSTPIATALAPWKRTATDMPSPSQGMPTQAVPVTVAEAGTGTIARCALHISIRAHAIAAHLATRIIRPASWTAPWQTTAVARLHPLRAIPTLAALVSALESGREEPAISARGLTIAQAAARAALPATRRTPCATASAPLKPTAPQGKRPV